MMNIKITIAGSLQEINGIDTAVASKANKKRKQQRDAVDAILSSALISSKKSETSGKLLPSKRPNSQMNPKVQSIRPPNPGKGKFLFHNSSMCERPYTLEK